MTKPRIPPTAQKRNTIIAAALCSAGLFLGACNWTKEKARETIHKSGEIVGKAGSEAADGIRKGVQESFANLVELSPAFQRKGLTVGRVMVSGTDSSTDNIVSVYLIFDSSYAGKITARAVDENNLEFGRAGLSVNVASGVAQYMDFVFDRRTNIDRGDKIFLE